MKGAAQTELGQSPTSPPTSAALFLGFLGLGLISFGGALPHARRIIVEQRRWLSAEDFTDMLGLCQFLPGGNIINLSVAIGMRFRGLPGAFASILGLILFPSIVVVLLGMVYEHTQDDPRVRHLFAGLAASAAGLLVAMSIKIVQPLRRQPIGAFIAILGFIAIAFLRIPLLPTMLVLTPISIFLIARFGSPPPPPSSAPPASSTTPPTSPTPPSESKP